MSADDLKRQAAEAAMAYVEEDTIVGVGTGSTVNYFIDCLAAKKHLIEGAVASSVATEERLKQHGIPVIELNSAPEVAVYIDGADEVNNKGQMIKGGGGALTREKIVATVAKKMVAIVDESKFVSVLGETFPLPIEVIPMARSYVGRQIIGLKGDPDYRAGFVTDNAGVIIDVHYLDLVDPLAMERRLNAITGVVENGLFAERTADVILVAKPSGVETIKVS